MKRARRESHKPIKQEVKVDETGFRKFNSHVQTLNTNAQGLRKGGLGAMGTLAGLGPAAAAAAAGVGVLIGAYKLGKDSIDTVEKLAGATRTLQATMRVDQKQAGVWAELLKVYGVDANQAGIGFSRLNKNIVAAQGGSKPMVDALAQLGVHGKEIKSIGIDQLIIRASAAFKNGVPGQRESAAMVTLFGRNYRSLLPLLRQGDEKLGKNKKLVEEWNATVGTKAMGDVGKAKQAQRELAIGYDSIKIAIGSRLLPILNGLHPIALGALKGIKSGAHDVKAAFIGMAHSGVFSGFVKGIKTLWSAASSAFGSISRSVKQNFGGGNGKGMGKDIQSFVKAIGNAFSIIARVASVSINLLVPIFTGMIRMVRGVVRVITGILTLDFGRVWSGLVDIVGGAFDGIFGLLGRVAGLLGRAIMRILRPIGRWFASGFNAAVHAVGGAMDSVINAVTSAPGKIAGAVGAFASAGLHLAEGLVNGIINTIKSAGSSVINAVYDLLPGPLKDALKTAGGVVGALFGRTGGRISASGTVGFHATGGRVGPSTGGPRLYVAGEGGKDEWVISQEGDRRQNISWATEALSVLTGRQVSMFSRGGRISALGNTLASRDTWYGLHQRAYELSDGGIDSREYALLAGEKAGTRTIMGQYLNELTAGIREANAGISRNRGKGKAKKAAREVWQSRLDDWTGRRAPLDADLEALRLDLIELDQQRGSAVGTTLAAMQQFVGDRQSAFRSFGGNFIAQGSAITGATMAAGTSAWGGGQSASLGARQSALRASGGQVTITNNFTRPPVDPHSWSQGIKWEIAHAL